MQFLSVRGERPHSQRYSFGASPALRARTEIFFEKVIHTFFVCSIVYVDY